MNALIVAAGQSSRLYPRTLETPKCMLELGGEALIDRSIRLLEENGVENIYVVVGFQHDKLKEHLAGRAEFFHNPFYASTNNMASLWFALPRLPEGELLYLHSDLIYDEGILKDFITARTEDAISLSVDFDSVHPEAMKVRCDKGKFVESSKEIPLDQAAGEWIGLTHFPLEIQPVLQRTMTCLLMEEKFNDYDTSAFNRLAGAGIPFNLIPTEKRPWLEIDDEEDWQRARQLFEN
ncbi:MAG: NTP transferase domain-containing protein [bacterium]